MRRCSLELFDWFKKKKRIENINLEIVMREMSKKSDMRVRRVLYSELLKSTLLLPTPSPLEALPDEAALKEIQVVTQKGPKNELVWIAFTSKTALTKWRIQSEDSYIAIQGIHLFNLAIQNQVEAILINPAGPIGGKITRMELNMLAEGAFPQGGDGLTHQVRPSEGAPVLIGSPPRFLPPNLEEFFWERLSKENLVLAGYVASIKIGKGNSHLVLAIEYGSVPQPESNRALLDTIGAEIKKRIGPEEYIDMVSFDQKHEWCNAIRRHGVVIYKRNSESQLL